MHGLKSQSQLNNSTIAGLSPRYDLGRGFYFAYYYFFGIFKRLHAGDRPV